MRESQPFAELFRQLMKDGTGRVAWLRSSTKSARKVVPPSEEDKPWGPKEIAAACGVDVRTVQTWRARKNPQEPSEQNLLRLEAALYGAKPSSEQRQTLRVAVQNQQELRRLREAGESWDLEEHGSPYRGIASPLTDTDAPIFFGRQTQLAVLIEKLRRRRCIFVVGASGAGKSSLVWAGLVPSLINQNAISGSKSWTWARLTPGEDGDPVRALAHALATKGKSRSAVERCLQASNQEISQLVEDLLEKRPRTAEMLLFIDQFEELFTIAENWQRRALFIDALAALIETKRIRVVATIRAEFIGYCTNSDGFGEQLANWLTEGTIWLAPPGLESLREMIWGPAQRAGLSFDEGLVDSIVEATGSKPGNLPLMAFALERLFEGRDADQRMTWDAYNSFGGVEGAIAERASAVFDELATNFGKEAEEALWNVFRDLVELDEESGAAVRRRLPLARLPADGPTRELVEKFVAARLLVRGSHDANRSGATAKEDTLEVAHEALFRNWPQLERWIDARRSHFVLRQRLARDAREWERLGKPRSYAWSDERALDAAVMMKELRQDLTLVERQFLGPIVPDEMLGQVEQDSTTHEERAMIGVRLALLGDPRLGVGLRSDGLPDIQWLRVHPRQTAGRAIQPFWVAKFPITYAQYRSFIGHPDGYSRTTWWTDLERAYTEPGDQFPSHGNHPAVNVLWCEAVAFCRWLGALTDMAIRLPTEHEWRMAATGGRKWRYPWGDDWNLNAANTDGSKLNRSIAVGLYPRGRSAVGALDMAGNVWEWCLNELGNPDNVAPRGTVNRATLGGSWNSVLQDVVVDHSGGYDFKYRNLNTGFRIIRTS